MRVEWRTADAHEDARQPVNQTVLVVVCQVLAERARATALAANRHGEFDEAHRVIRDIITHLRGLAPDNPQIAAVINTLRRDERRLGRSMPRGAVKEMHFASYLAAESRLA